MSETYTPLEQLYFSHTSPPMENQDPWEAWLGQHYPTFEGNATNAAYLLNRFSRGTTWTDQRYPGSAEDPNPPTVISVVRDNIQPVDLASKVVTYNGQMKEILVVGYKFLTDCSVHKSISYKEESGTHLLPIGDYFENAAVEERVHTISRHRNPRIGSGDSPRRSSKWRLAYDAEMLARKNRIAHAKERNYPQSYIDHLTEGFERAKRLRLWLDPKKPRSITPRSVLNAIRNKAPLPLH